MSSSIASLIIPGAKNVRAYAERLVKDIPAEKFARTPKIGATNISINHPAFNIGHLSLYPGRIAPFLHLDVSAIDVPNGYEELFKDGTPCQDDPAGIIYPPKEEICNHYFRGLDGILERFDRVSDELLLRTMPDPKRVERFPTIGSFAIYLLSAHMNGHLGQISAWRRCMGMGPA